MKCLLADFIDWINSDYEDEEECGESDETNDTDEEDTCKEVETPPGPAYE